MSSWTNEFMAEYHHRRILKEVEQIRLEKFALMSRSYRPRVFRRVMFNFGNWMISIGRQLRKRSEAPGDQGIFPTPN